MSKLADSEACSYQQALSVDSALLVAAKTEAHRRKRWILPVQANDNVVQDLNCLQWA